MPEPLEQGKATTAPPADVAVEEPRVADEELVLEDLLVEDVSIDGMCGVY